MLGFWVKKISWRRKWQPLQHSCLRTHGQGEPDRLQSMGSQRQTKLTTHTQRHYSQERGEYGRSHTLFFSAVSEVLAAVIKEKKIKGIHIGNKEGKLSLFEDNMKYTCKNPIRKLLILNSEFGSCRIQNYYTEICFISIHYLIGCDR